MPPSPTSLAIRHIQLLSLYVSCKHCHLFLSNPHRLLACGHVFCHQCAKRTKQAAKCPLPSCATVVQPSEVIPCKETMALVQTVQRLRHIARIAPSCLVKLRRRESATNSTHLHAMDDTLAQPAPPNTTPAANTQTAGFSQASSRPPHAEETPTAERRKHPDTALTSNSILHVSPSSQSPMPAQQSSYLDHPPHNLSEIPRTEQVLVPCNSHPQHSSLPFSNSQLHPALEIPDEPHVDTTQESASSQPIQLSQLPFDIPEEPNLDTSQETLSPTPPHMPFDDAHRTNDYPARSSPSLSHADPGSAKQASIPHRPFPMYCGEGDASSSRVEALAQAPSHHSDPTTPCAQTDSPCLDTLDQLSSRNPHSTCPVSLRLRVRPPGPVYLSLPLRPPECNGGHKVRSRRFRKRPHDYSRNQSTTPMAPESDEEELRQRSQKRRRLLQRSESAGPAPNTINLHRDGIHASESRKAPCSEHERGPEVCNGGPPVPLRLCLRVMPSDAQAPTTPLFLSTNGNNRGARLPQLSNTPASRKTASTRLGLFDRPLAGDCFQEGREISPLHIENVKRKVVFGKSGVQLKDGCDVEGVGEFQESSDITTQSPTLSDTVGGFGKSGERVGSTRGYQAVVAATESNGPPELSNMPFAVCISGVSKGSAELELAEALIPLRGAEFSDGFDCDPAPSCVLTTFDANNRIQQPRMVVFEAMAHRVPIVNVAWLVASHTCGFLVDTAPFEATSDHRKSGPGVFEGLVATIDKAFDDKDVPAMVLKAGRDIRRLLRAGGALVVESGELGRALQREKHVILHIHVINDFADEEQNEARGPSERIEEFRASQQSVPTKFVSIGWIGECLGTGAIPPPVQSCRLESSSWQSSVVEECR